MAIFDGLKDAYWYSAFMWGYGADKYKDVKKRADDALIAVGGKLAPWSPFYKKAVLCSAFFEHTKRELKTEVAGLVVSKLDIDQEKMLQNHLVLLAQDHAIEVYFTMLDQFVEAKLLYVDIAEAFKSRIKEGEYEEAFERLTLGINESQHKDKLTKMLGIAKKAYEQASFRNQVWLVINVAKAAFVGYVSYLYFFDPKSFDGHYGNAKASFENLKALMNKLPFPNLGIGAWISKMPVPTAPAVIMNRVETIAESVDEFGRYIGWKQVSKVTITKVVSPDSNGLSTEVAREISESYNYGCLWDDLVGNAIPAYFGLGAIKEIYEIFRSGYQDRLCDDAVREFAPKPV